MVPKAQMYRGKGEEALKQKPCTPEESEGLGEGWAGRG